MSEITLLKSCAEDLDVVNAARVSLAAHSDAMTLSDEKLIGYLMKNRHGSPFEHTYFKFFVRAPIFVFREWHRHRVGHSYNEMSGRYVELPEEFYEPRMIRSQEGKPGHYTFVERAGPKEHLVKFLMRVQNRSAFKTYRLFLKLGVAKEQARNVLPVATHSQMIWSCNSRSLMHFLSLRTHPSAQAEIRDLAYRAEEIFMKEMPITWKAFVDSGYVAP